MGLIDRDYTHDKDRERPFSPPPDRFGTLSKVLVFVAVLFLLYKAGDWKLTQWTAKRMGTPPAATGPVGSPLQSVAPAVPQMSASPSTYPSASETTGNTRTVTKCIVNGKTSYGDESCTVGGKATQIVTRDNHNLMAAVRVPTVIHTEEPAQLPHTFAQSEQGANQVAMKAECNALDDRVKYLDAMARQPQSGQMQDWIREERKKMRDRQARIPCR